MIERCIPEFTPGDRISNNYEQPGLLGDCLHFLSTSNYIHLDEECQPYLWILDAERHQVSVDTD